MVKADSVVKVDPVDASFLASFSPTHFLFHTLSVSQQDAPSPSSIVTLWHPMEALLLAHPDAIGEIFQADLLYSVTTFLDQICLV